MPSYCVTGLVISDTGESAVAGGEGTAVAASGPVTVPRRWVSKAKALAVTVPKRGSATAPPSNCGSSSSGVASYPRLLRRFASDYLDGDAAVADRPELAMPMSPPPTPRTWLMTCIHCGIQVNVTRAVVPREEQLCALCAEALPVMEMSDIMENLCLGQPEDATEEGRDVQDAQVDGELSDGMRSLSLRGGRRRRKKARASQPPKAGASQPPYTTAEPLRSPYPWSKHPAQRLRSKKKPPQPAAPWQQGRRTGTRAAGQETAVAEEKEEGEEGEAERTRTRAAGQETAVAEEKVEGEEGEAKRGARGRDERIRTPPRSRGEGGQGGGRGSHSGSVGGGTVRGRVGAWADEGRRSRSRSARAGQDDNATLNLVIAQFVLALHVTEEDFIHLMQNTSAVLVMVFIDVEHERNEPWWKDMHNRRWAYRENILHTYVEDGNNLWEGKLFSHGTGALFWRTHRVSAVAEIAPRLLNHGDWAYVSYKCTLKENDYNPECDIVIAGVFRTTVHCLPHWDTAFQEFVKKRIRSDEVRFLCGIFEVDKAQLEDVCRSCGAMGPVPFYQPWQLKGGQLTVTHPLYIIPFGRCKRQVDVKGPPSEMPDWLWGHPSQFNVDFLPEIPVGGPHRWHLRDLGKVKQKAVDLQRWVPNVHQVLLWVGSSRNGRPMLGRQQQQRYERGGHHRSRGRSVDPSGGAASSGLDRTARPIYWSGVVPRSDR